MKECIKPNKTTENVCDYSIKDEIAKRMKESPEFAAMWEESREEYKIIGEMTSIRRQKKITQTELAKRTGYKQQVISRIEKHDNTPSLKVLCKILDALGYELRIVEKT
nr:MAG TPA: Helix-turn-helix XRE-family like protein [Caudoviricetes sp.]